MNDAIWNRCDWEQKIAWFVNNHSAENQSDYKDHQWFQTGYNGYNKFIK